MYSIILATMLTTGAAQPDMRFGCHGCHGCCGGCYGCCGGCYGCCGGCWGCYGCCGGCWGGCYGCWGGCYGCCGGCWGCYGCCGGCWGCYGASYYPTWGGCYGCYGCYGCCGGAVVAPVVAATVPAATIVPTTPALPAAPKKDEKKAALGNAAEVVLKAPADVQLSVEGRPISRTTTEQAFRTSELEPGSSYTYTFQAKVVREGRTVAYTKQVKVRAGQVSVADFTKLATQGKEAARVTVKLPADARLFVDDVPCPLTTATRTFDTPDLEAGRPYYYTLRAEVVRDGTTRIAEKRVPLEAGRQVTVEFKDLALQAVSR